MTSGVALARCGTRALTDAAPWRPGPPSAAARPEGANPGGGFEGVHVLQLPQVVQDHGFPPVAWNGLAQEANALLLAYCDVRALLAAARPNNML